MFLFCLELLMVSQDEISSQNIINNFFLIVTFINRDSDEEKHNVKV